jgi:hypothetical protein
MFVDLSLLVVEALNINEKRDITGFPHGIWSSQCLGVSTTCLLASALLIVVPLTIVVV